MTGAPRRSSQPFFCSYNTLDQVFFYLADGPEGPEDQPEQVASHCVEATETPNYPRLFGVQRKRRLISRSNFRSGTSHTMSSKHAMIQPAIIQIDERSEWSGVRSVLSVERPRVEERREQTAP